MQKVVGSNPIIRSLLSLLESSTFRFRSGEVLSARHVPGDSVSCLCGPQQRCAGGGAGAARLRGFHRKVYSSRPMRSIVRDQGARSSRLHCRGPAAEPSGRRRGRAISSTRPHCARSSRGLRECQFATVLGEDRAFVAAAAAARRARRDPNDEKRQQQRRASDVQPQR